MALFSEQYIDDYRIRRATLDDIAVVMATFHADDGAHIGFQVATEALLQDCWRREEGNLALDAWIAETYDGQIIATADVSGGRGDACLNSSVAIDPAHAGRGLEGALVSLVEARARQIAEWTPADECGCPAPRLTARDAATPTARSARGGVGARIHWEARPVDATFRMDGGAPVSGSPLSGLPRGVVVAPVRARSGARTPRTVSRRVRGRRRGHGQFTCTCAPTCRGGCPVVDQAPELRYDEAWGCSGSPLPLCGEGAGGGGLLLAFPASLHAAVSDPSPRPLALCA